jgi:hypothetical protein
VRRLHRARQRPRHQVLQHAGRAGQGAEVTTIEGMAAADGTMHPMQAAFKECHGLQCGFCTPGMVMSAVDLCKNHPGQRGRDPRAARGQPVPLHGLPEHRQGRAAGQQAMAKPNGADKGDTTMGASDFRQAAAHRRVAARKEDYRFLTGAGQYTDDINLANQKYAVFVRSPHAHAVIKSHQRQRPRPSAPGVTGVFTGKDMAAGKMGGLPCGWLITSTDGSP